MRDLALFLDILSKPKCVTQCCKTAYTRALLDNVVTMLLVPRMPRGKVKSKEVKDIGLVR